MHLGVSGVLDGLVGDVLCRHADERNVLTSLVCV